MIIKRVETIFAMVCCFFVVSGTLAATIKSPCLDCHEDPSILSILQTKHGMSADKRTPFAQNACQTCHGDSTEHMNSGGSDQPPTVKFGVKSSVPVAEQNKVCLKCHESGLRMHWKGSQHESAELACNSCHTIHAPADKVLNPETESEICFNCHKTQRAQIHRFSVHPIEEGKVSCTQCHNPHGSAGPKLLNKLTLNEVCYTCHAEKRGPFLWEHQPVREDCSICHTSHGSNHRSLLKARIPWLCQQCHLENFHPSTAYDGINTPTNSVDTHTLGKACLNCHTNIHGSNHPSGVRKTR